VRGAPCTLSGLGYVYCGPLRADSRRIRQDPGPLPAVASRVRVRPKTDNTLHMERVGCIENRRSKMTSFVKSGTQNRKSRKKAMRFALPSLTFRALIGGYGPKPQLRDAKGADSATHGNRRFLKVSMPGPASRPGSSRSGPRATATGSHQMTVRQGGRLGRSSHRLASGSPTKSSFTGSHSSGRPNQ